MPPREISGPAASKEKRRYDRCTRGCDLRRGVPSPGVGNDSLSRTSEPAVAPGISEMGAEAGTGRRPGTRDQGPEAGAGCQPARRGIQISDPALVFGAPSGRALPDRAWTQAFRVLAIGFGPTGRDSCRGSGRRRRACRRTLRSISSLACPRHGRRGSPPESESGPNRSRWQLPPAGSRCI